MKRKLKNFADIDLRKYSVDQLQAINEVFGQLADFQATELNNQVPSVAAFDAEQLELDALVELAQAENQAKDYAARRNENKRSAQGDDELREGIFKWMKRTRRNRRQH